MGGEGKPRGSSCWGKKLSSICPQLVGTLALEGFQALRGNPPLTLSLLLPALTPTPWAASPAPPVSPRNVKR